MSLKDAGTVPASVAPASTAAADAAATTEAVYRFGLLLALLIVSFVFLASAPAGRWIPFVTTVLQGAILLASLRVARVRRRRFRFAVILVALLAVASLASVFTGTTGDQPGAFYVVSALLVAAAPVAIARSAWRRHRVDVQTVLAALCIYVLIGMLCSVIYLAIDAIGSDPFFVQTAKATTADFLYFSYVTLTTVGYGDFTAAGGLGRALAVVEALTGQIYLVTVVAVLVSNLGRSARGAAPSHLAGDDATPPRGTG